MAAAAAAPRKGVATSGNVCSYRGKSVALDVHFAVWDGDLALLHKLLASQCYDLETRDASGFTPYLLALALGRSTAAAMLLAAGAYAKARLPHDKLKGLNGLAWECYQVAALTTNPHLVRSTVMAMLRETDIAFQRRAPRLAEGFASMPDFEMTMVWEFSSWIPFVSGLLPKDTMTIRKRGTALRMDSTLLGMSGMTWQRGDVSQIVRVQAERGSHEGQFLLLDNKARTAGDGRESFLCPEDKNVQDWVRKVLSTPQKVSDWWSKDTTFKQVFTKGWLGGTTTDPKTADVDVWTGCTLYDMAGLKQTELTHAAIRKDLALADWWLPVYEKAKWGALEAGAAPDSVDLHQHSGALVEDRPEAGL
ncbi:Ankrd13b, partial [Symbiodinium sp. KB8]